jgi:hypothetical protein
VFEQQERNEPQQKPKKPYEILLTDWASQQQDEGSNHKRIKRVVKVTISKEKLRLSDNVEQIKQCSSQ